MENSDQTVEIYALRDPRCGSIRYIGKAKDSQKRLKGHLRDANRRSYPVYCWIRELRKVGLVPSVEVVRVVPASDWQRHEREIITEYRGIARLLNVAEGGDQPHITTEQRAANARKVAKSVHSDPIRKRLWLAKRHIAECYRFCLKHAPERAGRIRERMRELARTRPKHCGEWA